MSHADFDIRMKVYEKTSPASNKLIPLLPTFARIDGKSFHAFTRGLNRPFDDCMIQCMQNTTKFLVEETNAKIGYTQSDEITLMWYSSDYNSQIFFDGKLYKMISVLASMATYKFNKEKVSRLSGKVNTPAYFDCRVYQVPSRTEAVNVFKWREVDAVRNSISMLAQSLYSSKELHNKTCNQMQGLCLQKGSNWNDLPDHKKRGSYYGKMDINRKLTSDELKKLPPYHHAHKDPDFIIKRGEVVNLALPILSTIENPINVIFRGFSG
jgi:tRNA(His) 5'-end guanylyltransferase